MVYTADTADQTTQPAGRKRGRPQRSKEMQELLAANAQEIARLLPDMHLRGADLLTAIYRDARQPLLLRLMAAQACIPVENRNVAAAEVLDGIRRRQVAERIVADAESGKLRRTALRAAQAANGTSRVYKRHQHAPAPPAEAIDLDDLLGE